ncbi:O-antigen ligase family protein [Pseudomonas oryzihabitans]|uniref:O-antigen ligase family protein n=1 Tax=Pseudomonas oryzihabitans TaxID=47885 RepID=UPI00241FCC56|nr:O-antigen ligase family protein [Pseudomonas oryzihabitans]
MQYVSRIEFWTRWKYVVFSAGLFWFAVGMGIAPRNKNYQQVYLFVVVLPFFIDLLLSRDYLRFFLNKRFFYFLAIFALAVIPVFFFEGGAQGWHTLKRSIYIMAFLFCFYTLACKGVPEVRRVVVFVYWMGGVVAFCSVLNFYLIQGRSPYERLLGLGVLDDPIMGAYAISMMLIGGWCLNDRQETFIKAFFFYCSAASMFCYVVLTQSRGAFFALFLAFLLRSVLHFSKKEWLVSFLCAMFFILVLGLFYPLVVERGFSFRPAIIHQAVIMIGYHPWFGIEGPYKIYVPELGMEFAHAHNMLLHIGITNGLIVLAVWLVVWMRIFILAWKYRAEVFSGYVLVAWFFSTVAMQFDGARFIDTPRPEWLISWWVVGLYIVLSVRHSKESQPALSR